MDHLKAVRAGRLFQIQQVNRDLNGRERLDFDTVFDELDVEEAGVDKNVLLPEAEGFSRGGEIRIGTDLRDAELGALGDAGIAVAGEGDAVGAAVETEIVGGEEGFDGVRVFIRRAAVAHDFIAVAGIGEIFNRAGVVALDGADHFNTVLPEGGMDDADMVTAAVKIPVKEDQVARLGHILAALAVEAGALEGVHPGDDAGIAGHELLRHLGIVKAEGDEHGAPALIVKAGAVPGAVAGVAHLLLFAVFFFIDEVALALGVTQLGFGNGDKALVIGAFEGLPAEGGEKILLRLQIGKGVRLLFGLRLIHGDGGDDIADIGVGRGGGSGNRHHTKQHDERKQQTCESFKLKMFHFSVPFPGNVG